MLERLYGIKGVPSQELTNLVHRVIAGDEEVLKTLSDCVIVQAMSADIAKEILHQIHKYVGHAALLILVRSSKDSYQIDQAQQARIAILQGLAYEVLYAAGEKEFFNPNQLEGKDESPVLKERRAISAWVDGNEDRAPNMNCHFNFARHKFKFAFPHYLAQQHYFHLTTDLAHKQENGISSTYVDLYPVTRFLEDTVYEDDQKIKMDGTPDQNLTLKLILIQSGFSYWGSAHRAHQILQVHQACQQHERYEAMRDYCLVVNQCAIDRGLAGSSIALAYADFRLRRLSLSDEETQAVLRQWGADKYSEARDMIRDDPTMTLQEAMSLKARLLIIKREISPASIAFALYRATKVCRETLYREPHPFSELPAAVCDGLSVGAGGDEEMRGIPF
jgi:hypothetical protein